MWPLLMYKAEQGRRHELTLSFISLLYRCFMYTAELNHVTKTNLVPSITPIGFSIGTSLMKFQRSFFCGRKVGSNIERKALHHLQAG